MPTYPTEPRVQFVTRDQGILPIDEGPITDRVLVIGPAVDGPNDQAIRVGSMDQLSRIFGPTNKRPELGDQTTEKGFNGNWLVRTAREVFDGGCRDIWVRRVGGAYATATLGGYNYVTNDAVTITPSGAVNLTYGGFPTSNAVVATTAMTISAISGADVRVAGNPASLSLDDHVDWFVYDKGRFVDARITAVNGLTLTLSEDLSSYLVEGDDLVIFPKNNVRVYDTSGQEFNPFNFIVTAGSSTINSSLAFVASASVVTLDPRYARSTVATAGERVIVHYLMKPNKVIDLQSRTPAELYNARGLFGSAEQDGCWVTVTQSLTTMGTIQMYVPKYRSSPLTAGNIPMPAVSFRLSDVGSFDELISKVNRHGRNTSITANLATDATWNDVAVEINGSTSGYRGLTNAFSGRTALLDPILSSALTARFVGGASNLDLSPDAFYTLLTGGSNPDDDGILGEIEETPCQIRVIAGVNADDTVSGVTGKWAETLATHCWNASRGGRPCVGVLGVKAQSPTDIAAADIRNRVLNLVTAGSGLADALSSTITALDADAGESVDVGAYLSVCAGPDGVVRDADLGAVVSNLAGIYAGVLASLPINRSTTQVPLRGVRGLLYDYNRKQRHQMTEGVGYADLNRGGAYVTFRRDPDGGALIVHSGETCAGRTSQFTKVGVLRIVQMAETLVARAARKYIGQPNNLPVHQAMENDCKQQLEKLAEMRALAGRDGVGYQLRVYASGNDRKIGKVNIEMNLRTATEIRWIYVPVTVEF
jgi:hypothetical protein